MREIKFRGFNGEKWLYGDLASNYKTRQATISDDRRWRHPVRFYTVGQYTGLKDATGKEIYEGDIVKLSPQFSVKQGLKREFRFPAVVRWDERLARFSLRSMEIIDSLRDSEYITVIGNIHDNPELLEATVGGRP